MKTMKSKKVTDRMEAAAAGVKRKYAVADSSGSGSGSGSGQTLNIEP
jgi:hypothetical protein